MSDEARRKWDARYRQAEAGASAAAVLLEHERLIPATGRALDLACGLGANALYLARLGLEVEAWDISPVAIERLEHEANAKGLNIHTQTRDIVAHPPAPGAFDLIVVSRFLERGLCPAIAAALVPGGRLFYQTFSAVSSGSQGPRNPAFLLQPGELRQLFATLKIEVYKEDDEAILVGTRV